MGKGLFSQLCSLSDKMFAWIGGFQSGMWVGQSTGV